MAPTTASSLLTSKLLFFCVSFCRQGMFPSSHHHPVLQLTMDSSFALPFSHMQ